MPGTADDTPLRATLDAALAALEAEALLRVPGDRDAVLDRLAARLADAGLLAADATRSPADARAALADAIERAMMEGFDGPAWTAAMATRHADARLEEARRQAGLVRLRLQQGSITTEQAETYLRHIAAGLRAGGAGR